jgi:hypothetical protein
MLRRRPLSGLQRPRVGTLIASALAGLGLLGHGVAMLLVAALAAPPAAGSGAAAAGYPAYVEICAADGEIRLAPADNPAERAPAAPQPAGHDSGHLNACPVCTAFAQNGLADLPTLVVLAEHAVESTAWQPMAAAARAGRDGLSALSRGPPAA